MAKWHIRCMENGNTMLVAGMELDADQQTLTCFGQWTTHHIDMLAHQLKSLSPSKCSTIRRIDSTKIETLDSAGAFLLCKLARSLGDKKHLPLIMGLEEKQQSL